MRGTALDLAVLLFGSFVGGVVESQRSHCSVSLEGGPLVASVLQ